MDHDEMRAAMTDDIVTRLRKWAKRADRWNYENETFPELREAADEIERLRAELEEARKGREAYGQVIFSLQEQLREYEDD